MMFNSPSLRDKNYEYILRDGINAARDGNMRLAFSLLNQAAQTNALDARPWLWLTETTTDLAEKIDYLEKAVAADPGHAAARRALAALTGNPIQMQMAPDGLAVQSSDGPVRAETQESFQCPNCGGHVEFNIQTSQLTCLYCGYSPEAVEERSAADDERSIHHVLPTAAAHRWAVSQQHLHCQRCGADSLWPPAQKAAECPYCGSSQLIVSQESEGLVDPQAIALMQLDEAAAVKKLQDWFGRGWFAPDDLTKAAERKLLQPVYFPFWTFDGTLELAWSCEVDEGGSSRSRNWVAYNGTEFELFNDVVVPGLERIKFKDMNRLGPFNMLDVVEFKPEYLAGWPALSYDRPLSKASLLGREQAVRKVRGELFYRVMPGKQKRNLRTGGVKWSDMTYKYVLLPVWTGTYHYQGQEFQVMVNGQTGRVMGEKPRDMLKTFLIITSVLASIIVVLIFLALGGFQLGLIEF